MGMDGWGNTHFKSWQEWKAFEDELIEENKKARRLELDMIADVIESVRNHMDNNLLCDKLKMQEYEKACCVFDDRALFRNTSVELHRLKEWGRICFNAGLLKGNEK